MTDQSILNTLQPRLIQCETIAIEAGDAIMDVYDTDFNVISKDDQSPLTEADLASDRVIAKGLKQITPDIPILSEESAKLPYETRKRWTTYWLIDPLDGTREFVKRNGEFTVNIALIHKEESILGVVYAPVTKTTWSAARGHGSHRVVSNNTAQSIRARTYQKDTFIAAVSRSHGNERQQQFLASVNPVDTITSGSSIKMCLVADGTVDLYARLGLTSEWDTAAAQCVLEESGGQLTTTDMQQLRYNTKDSLLNPEFFAFGRDAPDWSQHLD